MYGRNCVQVRQQKPEDALIPKCQLDATWISGRRVQFRSRGATVTRICVTVGAANYYVTCSCFLSRAKGLLVTCIGACLDAPSTLCLLTCLLHSLLPVLYLPATTEMVVRVLLLVIAVHQSAILFYQFCLSVCPSVCLLNAVTVSKRMGTSSHFFDTLVGYSF